MGQRLDRDGYYSEKQDLPAALAHAHRHDVIRILCSQLFVRFHHLGYVIVADQGRVNENEGVVAVQHLDVS